MLKDNLSKFDATIADVNIKYGPNRQGDIPHSLASVEKAKELLSYNPTYSIESGLEEARWYWDNLRTVVVEKK